VNKSGFTLIEMMIATMLSMVIGAAGYTFFINAFHFSTIQSSNAEMQRETRIGIDMMIREIRNAGYGVIEPLTGNTHSSAAAFSVFTAGNNIDLDPDGVANKIDRISVSGGFQLVGSLTLVGTEGSNTITVTPLAGTNPSNPSIDGLTVTLDGFHTSNITDVAADGLGNYILTLDLPLNRNYSTSTSASIIQTITYSVAPFGTEPALWRNDGTYNQVIASNIEDLQFAYLLSDGTVVDNPLGMASSVRAVRVSLLARGKDPVESATISTRPAIEDHVAATTADVHHRRLITRVVEIRNLGL